MTYTIKIDVLDAVQGFYPGLSDDDAKKIAKKIVGQWDYSSIYNDIADQIEHDANELGIELEGKDGVNEEVNNVYVLNKPPSRLFP